VPTFEYRRVRPAPLLHAVGPWKITVSSGAGSLVKRPQWTLAARALRIVLGRGLPIVKFFQSRYFKKLARTAFKFNRSPRPRVTAFLLQTNGDLKNRSFKLVDQKNFKYSSVSYLRPKASPNMLFLYTFFVTQSLLLLSISLTPTKFEGCAVEGI
jgi:hypothetical protein